MNINLMDEAGDTVQEMLQAGMRVGDAGELAGDAIKSSSAVRGTLTGKLEGLTAAEKTMVNDLLNAGNDVEIIPRSNISGQKTPDFLVNGVKTELKTIDIANTVIERALGKYGGELPGTVEIWTIEGIIGGNSMAGMTCTCGAELSNHEVPNDIQLRVYTDREWDEIFDCNIVLKQQKRGANQGWDTIRKIFIKMWGDSNGG